MQNDIEKMKKRNDVVRRLGVQDRNHRKCIRLHPQNSKKHEMKKVEICWDLLQQEKEFVTEAIFDRENVRADVLNVDDKIIYEIETNSQDFENRKSDYPDDFEIRMIEV